MEQIESVRLCGYAINDMERNEEIRSISAPIKSANGTVIAGIAIDVPTHRITIPKLKIFAPKIMQTAKMISRGMGNIKNQT